jgi:uncharacterized protein RhaS with RHS repeats
MPGSKQVATNSSGNKCFHADYYPYGQENEYNTACSPTYKFTGYEYDAPRCRTGYGAVRLEGIGPETGNFYAGAYPESVVGARHYDPLRGRFMSPDPLGGRSAIHSRSIDMGKSGTAR